MSQKLVQSFRPIWVSEPFFYPTRVWEKQKDDRVWLPFQRWRIMRSLPWLQHLIRSWNSLLDYRQNCQEYDTNANLNDVNKQYYLEYWFLVQRIRRLLFLSIFVVPNLIRSSWTHVCFLLRPDFSPFPNLMCSHWLWMSTHVEKCPECPWIVHNL